MEILITVKSVSSRKKYLDQLKADVPASISTMQELVEELVRQNVNAYNASIEHHQLAAFLTASAIEAEQPSGKVGFRRVRGEQQVTMEKAFQDAEAAFGDGLYRVFLNEEEVLEYEQSMELKQGDELVFLRLTMLAGRMW